MANKKNAVDEHSESVTGLLTNSTEYSTNHPQMINWSKAKASVRSFVKSNKKLLRNACRGTEGHRVYGGGAF